MTKENPLTGYSWHIEYHTIDKKKDKAANCIYLSDYRTCQNKKSPQYLAKCFVASHCSFRVKEKNSLSEKTDKTLQTKPKNTIKPKYCLLPLNCPVYNETYGKGKYISYDSFNGVISVEFETKTIKFIYPDAIIKKHIIVPEKTYRAVLNKTNRLNKG